MSANQSYLLIDHLDKTLQPAQLAEAEELIHKDREAAGQWELLRLAVLGIEYAGLREQVAVVSKEWEAQNKVSDITKPALVRTLYRNLARVAACIILLVGSATVYKYMTVTSNGLFKEYYSSYELNTSRGSGIEDKLEEAYRDKNWANVLSLVNSSSDKSNKSYFLAGMANLELKKYDLAIADFKQVISENTRTADNYFGDEAEYYLAMSLIANNQTPKAIGILEKIRADKNHLYNKKLREISGLDFRILEFKSRK
jgi:hypothetical protein